MKWLKRNPRYLVFVFPRCYPTGGMGDLVDSGRMSLYQAKLTARHYARRMLEDTGNCEGFIRIHVVDRRDIRTVLAGDATLYSKDEFEVTWQ